MHIDVVLEEVCQCGSFACSGVAQKAEDTVSVWAFDKDLVDEIVAQQLFLVAGLLEGEIRLDVNAMEVLLEITWKEIQVLWQVFFTPFLRLGENDFPYVWNESHNDAEDSYNDANYCDDSTPNNVVM